MKKYVQVLFTMLLPAQAMAVCDSSADGLPCITNVSGGNNTRVQGQIYEVVGDNFGLKAGWAGHPAILFDMVETTYEGGVENTHHSTFTDGQRIERPDTDPDTIWTKPTLDGPINRAPVLTRSRTQRTDYSRAHYLMSGDNSFIGWPSAYGGQSTPVDQNRLYTSWWHKPKYDPRYYWTFQVSDFLGDFESKANIVGNVLKVGGFVDGYVINYDAASDKLEAVFYGQTNWNDLINRQVTLLDRNNNALGSAMLASTGMNSGPHKYLRIWEDPAGMTGTRLSFTNSAVATGGLPNTMFWPHVNENEWNFMEVMLDTNPGNLRVTVRINGQLITDQRDYSNAAADAAHPGEWSPTIALLGGNGSRNSQPRQEMEVDDIYMDSSFARVALGNKPTYSESTHFEMQNIVTWADNRIEFKLNYGRLNNTDPGFLYVFNSEGIPNEDGYGLFNSRLKKTTAVNINQVD